MKKINVVFPFIWLIILVVLAIYYAQLPEQIGTHLNFKGEVDAWGPKSRLWIVPIVMLIVWLFISLILHFSPVLEQRINGTVRKNSRAYRNEVAVILFIVQLIVAIIYTLYLINTIRGVSGLPSWLIISSYVVLGATFIVVLIRRVLRK